MIESNPRTTVTSIAGVSAYNMISRRAMMEGLCQDDGDLATVPFVRMFHCSPPEHLREDSEGVVHSIPQGQGTVVFAQRKR